MSQRFATLQLIAREAHAAARSKVRRLRGEMLASRAAVFVYFMWSITSTIYAHICRIFMMWHSAQCIIARELSARFCGFVVFNKKKLA